jgi:hypothetical protein
MSLVNVTSTPDHDFGLASLVRPEPQMVSLLPLPQRLLKQRASMNEPPIPVTLYVSSITYAISHIDILISVYESHSS